MVGDGPGSRGDMYEALALVAQRQMLHERSRADAAEKERDAALARAEVAEVRHEAAEGECERLRGALARTEIACEAHQAAAIERARSAERLAYAGLDDVWIYQGVDDDPEDTGAGRPVVMSAETLRGIRNQLRAVEAGDQNRRDLWAALAQIREACETCLGVGVLPSGEALLGVEPGPIGAEADAICRAIADAGARLRSGH